MGTLWDQLDRPLSAEVEPARRLLVDRQLARTAARRPDAIGLQWRDRAYTWGELDELVNRLANAMLDRGVRPLDVVALCLGNTPEHLALQHAVGRIGAAFAPLSTRLSGAEITYQMADSGAVLLIGEGGVDAVELAAAGSPHDPQVDVEEWYPFWVKYTGGTTGRPKGSVSSQRGVALNRIALAIEFGFGQDSVGYVNATLSHAGGTWAAAHVAVGATVVLAERFDADRVWLDCDQYGATDVFMVPTMYAKAIDSPGTGASLRTLISGAATMAPVLKQRLRDRFPLAGLHEYYGATEYGVISNLRPDEQADRPTSVGRPGFGATVAIVDDDGRPVPIGTVGEIRATGPSVHAGYVGASRPRGTITADGWTSVGDMGWLDDDGYLHIADRRTDMILSGGFNVYPAEVEAVLLEVPQVRQAAVVGIGDPVWGQRVVACYVGVAEPGELDRWCRERLAGYKLPRDYHRVDELPESAAGKVLRRLVREQLEAVAR